MLTVQDPRMVPNLSSGSQDGLQAQFRAPGWFPSSIKGPRMVPKLSSGFEDGPQT